MCTMLINLERMRNDLDKLDYNIGIMQEQSSGLLGWDDPTLDMNEHFLKNANNQPQSKQLLPLT